MFCFVFVFVFFFVFVLFLFYFYFLQLSSLSKFNLERIQQACLFTDRSFHSLVTLHRLAIWKLGPKPSVEALAHELTTHRCRFLLRIFITCFTQTLILFSFIGMTTKKENKGKMVDEETMQETHSQPRLVTGDKRKTLSRMVDLGSLPSRQVLKKSNHGSSKFGVIKLGSVVPLAIAKPPST